MQPEVMTEAEREKLAGWTYATAQEMIAAGHVEPPFAISDAMYGYLLDLYLFGLTPAEAAEAAFATRH